jgi:hypothetical protein
MLDADALGVAAGPPPPLPPALWGLDANDTAAQPESGASASPIA